MAAVQEYASKGSRAADVLRPIGLAFGNNDEPMKTFATAGAVILFVPLSGQNLVPNGSFEVYTDCPDQLNQLNGNVAGWSTCALTPDYFNACRDSSDFGVPLNWFGYQLAADGIGYVGMITHQGTTPHVREFICASLTSPLTIGYPVLLTMKVALGNGGSYPYPVQWTCRGIGMRLTTQPFEWLPQTPYPNSAQLHLNEVLTDTMEWMHLSTIYIPDSAYEFVTIGNFYDDAHSMITILDSSGGFNFAYAFVDDVCISSIADGCDGINSIRDQQSLAEWSTVIPFSDQLQISFMAPTLQPLFLALSDLGGRIVRTTWVRSGVAQFVWDTSGLCDGTYVLSTF